MPNGKDRDKEKTKEVKEPKDSKDVKKVNDDELERQIYYHGMRPRKEVTTLLKQSGSWLVRMTDKDGTLMLVLSYHDPVKGIRHLTLESANKRWSLNALRKNKKKKCKDFASVVELIEFYKNDKTELQLGTPVDRPQWMIKHDQLSFDRTKDLLGTGNFANVYKGIYKIDDKMEKIVAIKESITREAYTVEQLKKERESMLKEAETQVYYVHENVVRFFGVAADYPPIQVVMELCPGRDLMTHLQREKDNISVAERIVYIRDAARGMVYLHDEKNLLHRDIAARNCLIAANGYIKISDFGLSLLCEKKESIDIDEPGNHQLPVRHMAPETLKKPAIYSKKSDVWAFGMLIYEVFNNGVKPWPEDQPRKIATKIRRCEMCPLPENMPQDIKKLVKEDIWQTKAEARPSIKDTLMRVERQYRLIGKPEKPVIQREASLSRSKSMSISNDEYTQNDEVTVTEEVKKTSENTKRN
ncbi:unnamed protein product, partial [Mesorhabditis belari]|uniref:Tyrosine-protein kinase n=1 Tax=Mesorhabditis belari TaxID=2138241 RepID=A0AAF3EGV6_9BILA